MRTKFNCPDMRTPKEIREDNENARKSGFVTPDAYNTMMQTYCVDIASGLVMTRAEYLGIDRR